jgi:hypothetical protein
MNNKDIIRELDWIAELVKNSSATIEEQHEVFYYIMMLKLKIV